MPEPISLELRRFVNWLYEEGPDPDAVTRQKLLALYMAWVASTDKEGADQAA